MWTKLAARHLFDESGEAPANADATQSARQAGISTIDKDGVEVDD